MNFSATNEFNKELKRYSKKYRSLTDDLEKFKTLVGSSEALEAVQFFHGSQATKLQVSDAYTVVKARLDCADLGSKQLLRIIYIQNKRMVLFVELFAKSERPREDTRRIQSYLKAL
jgi:hypothetical protein